MSYPRGKNMGSWVVKNYYPWWSRLNRGTLTCNRTYMYIIRSVLYIFMTMTTPTTGNRCHRDHTFNNILPFLIRHTLSDDGQPRRKYSFWKTRLGVIRHPKGRQGRRVVNRLIKLFCFSFHLLGTTSGSITRSNHRYRFLEDIGLAKEVWKVVQRRV